MKTCSECKITKELTDFSPKRGQCKACRSAYSSKYRKENKETVNAGNRQYRADNPEATNGYSAKWAKANKDKVNSRSSRWGRNNPGKINARTAKRRAAKLQRTPPWLNKDHSKEIRHFYIKAKEQGLTVDHIIPLQGENVSGLHVPWNLQLLPKAVNSSKGNR